jgi:hypothetical protein
VDAYYPFRGLLFEWDQEKARTNLKKHGASFETACEMFLKCAYIGRGLRKDLKKLDRSPGKALAESLRKRGMSDHVIAEVIAEARIG